MTTTFEKSLDIHAPIQTVFEKWTDFESYPQFMPHLHQVRFAGGNQWIWESAGQQWQAELTQQTPQTSINWRISSPDHVCDATIRFEPLDGSQGTKLVYTAHYPNGFGPSHTAGSVANDMQITLEKFARLLQDGTPLPAAASQEAPEAGLSAIPAQQTQAVDDVLAPLNESISNAVQQLDEEIPHLVDTTTTLQHTLAEATQAWTSSVAKAFESFNALIWSPVESLGQELASSVRTWSPRFEMMQDQGMLLVRSELPGYEAQDLHVEIVDGDLLISGQRQTSQPPADPASADAVLHTSERFLQRMTLTQAVDSQHVEAQVTPSGQLRIVLPLMREAAAEASV